MQAITFNQYGSPDILRFEEIDQPTPQPDEVLVRVIAASVNPLDWHVMRGKPFLARLEFGLRRPKVNQLGADLAGIVEAVGRNVTEFEVSDEVWGDVFNSGLGSLAEYVCVPASTLVKKPRNLALEYAAAVPVAATTALQGLRTGNIKKRHAVLINGASGGVGTYAVQIAKFFGAEVTGVCSTRNLAFVRDLGADHVIDYTKTDFADGVQKYDLIFDAVGNRSVADLKRALTSDGQCVIAGFTTLTRLVDHSLLAPLKTMGSDQKVGMMDTAYPNKEDYLILSEMLEAGQIVPIIDRCYPLAESAEAIRYLETSRARGKVIIKITA